MSILNNKKISLALKTAGVMAVSTLVLGLSVGIESSTNISNKITSKNNLNKSANEINSNQLENSEFYFESFTFSNPDQGDKTTAALIEARTQWRAIKTNLDLYNPNSKTAPSYLYINQKLTDLEEWAVKLEVREALRVAGQMNIWDDVVSDSLGFESFNATVGTQTELDKNIKTLSGFVSGMSVEHQIKSIQNKASAIINLDTGKKTEKPAGLEYPTIITIAEINPIELIGDFKVDFQFSNESSINPHIEAQGSLIIRNKDGQLTNDTLSFNETNLEIFGRWTNLGKNKIDPTTNFKPEIDNFVLTKNSDGKILLIARLKDGDQLSNIRVDRSNGLQPIDSFGIINAQQVDTNPIYPESDIVDTVKLVKFFSTNLEISDATSADVEGSLNKTINKKYEFYLGDNTNLNLNLFYKNEKDNVYKTLFGFEDGEESTTKKQTLKIGVNSGIGESIASTKTEFSSTVLDEMGVSAQNVSNLSISLNTQKDDSNILFKQGFYFNDLLAFSIFGPSETSQTGSAIISLENNLTDKIFFEDPGFVSSNPIESSSSISSAWTNDDSEIIGALANVYEKWSQNNVIGSSQIGEKSYNMITYSEQGAKIKNISWKSASNNYTGRETYNSLVNEFEVYQQIISQLLGSQITPNIYKIGTGGTARKIVELQLLDIQNYDSLTLIKENVQMIIDSGIPIIEQEKAIEQELQELVRIKFFEMTEILTQPINNFYYEEIKKYLDSSLSLNKNMIADVSTFLEFDSQEGLFKLIDGNPSILIESANLTGSQKMESLFKLLYFGNMEYGIGELKSKSYFGNPIFDGRYPSNIDSFLSYENPSKQQELWTFTTTIEQNQKDLVNIYDSLLSIFGFGLNSITENSLETGSKIELKWGNYNLESAVAAMFEKLNSPSRETVDILGNNYKINALSSLITSSNIYNSLLFRKYNPPIGIESSEKDAEKINNILNSGITSPESIFTWSRIQKVGNDIELYTNNFSKNSSEITRLSNEIKTKLNILDIFIEEKEALFQINPFINVQVVWPILIGLIAVGMIVISSVSLAGSIKTSRISSKSVKIILIVVILISVVSLGLISGLVIPGLL